MSSLFLAAIYNGATEVKFVFKDFNPERHLGREPLESGSEIVKFMPKSNFRRAVKSIVTCDALDSWKPVNTASGAPEWVLSFSIAPIFGGAVEATAYAPRSTY